MARWSSGVEVPAKASATGPKPNGTYLSRFRPKPVR